LHFKGLTSQAGAADVARRSKVRKREHDEANMSTPTTALPFHPLANLFPLMDGREFEELVADIKANGLHECIVLLDEQILDGRNRHRACLAAGVEPLFVPYRGDDPAAYVVSMNVARRHLSESQRAMVAGKLATLKQGGNQYSEGLPIGRSSELLNVGDRSVARAHEVLDHGVPELRQAVERGEVSVSAAADVASEPAEQQREIVARGEREILAAPKAIRARKVAAKKPPRRSAKKKWDIIHERQGLVRLLFVLDRDLAVSFSKFFETYPDQVNAFVADLMVFEERNEGSAEVATSAAAAPTTPVATDPFEIPPMLDRRGVG
jgi:ParB-like chromosome segregation protein Spo0J